ncbi:gfo/Idh/MocA family oxidoreductase [Natrarchaeobius halalkaliphilus]|uniref:Gfo/Idh/MocA family oxidoreductase n=1 Tax=Natrarchaeobius halalkaliphilus TaxID=1679091 RepID=A0A3N6P066_9EURY|nr:Gfo/Idh/MocA family oxidoreductase [Natrarchaeobius halalkaliphilus]RQG87788.1 gfo/Idh/MocA family oxidoreductase [Natrarchaeobius halalkaliphilus]
MTLKIGFLGYGMMARAHAHALNRLPLFFPEAPETDRTIIAGRDPDGVSNAADRLGFDRSTTDWREVVPAVDVLYVLTPPTVHREPTVEALESGVHVLCEKPLSTSVSAGERMVETAADSDAVVGCGFNYRFLPAIQLLKQFVEEGELGTIRHVRGQFLQNWQADATDAWTWRNDAEIAGAGRVADAGSHSFDLARWLVGPIDSVSGQLTTTIDNRPVDGTDERRTVSTDDAYGVLARFDSGARAIFDGSRVATGHTNTNTIELVGSRGTARFHCERLNELEVCLEGDRGFRTISVTDPEDPYVDRWWPPGHGLGWEHSVVHENYEFLSAIRDDGTFEPDFETGLAVARIVDAVRRSDETGRRVAIR